MRWHTSSTTVHGLIFCAHSRASDGGRRRLCPPGEPRIAVAAYGGVELFHPIALSAGGDPSQTVKECSQPESPDVVAEDALPSRVGPAQTSRLVVGAAAVLCVAVSPDGSRLAAGCLDGRVRVFRVADGGPDHDFGATGRDWSGLPGPVHEASWSSGGRWLAAAGGATLLVVPSCLARGEAPTLCERPPNTAAKLRNLRNSPASAGCSSEGGTRTAARCWASLAWSRSREPMLAAFDVVSARVLVYDVAHTDGRVPCRAFATAIVPRPTLVQADRNAAPAAPKPGSDASLLHIRFCEASNKDGSEHIVASWGDCVACASLFPWRREKGCTG
jgi:hypothetical protein